MPPEDAPAGSDAPGGNDGEEASDRDGGASGADPVAGRGAPGDGGEDAGRVVPVILPGRKEGDPDPPPPGGGWRRGAGVLLLALLPVAVYAAWDRGWIDPGGAAESTAAADARAARRAVRGRFTRMTDSLQEAVQDYGERRSDFEKNRIGCAALGVGFEAVDRRFVQLSLLYRERKGDLDAGRADRYDSLVERVNEVNRHYDESGCRTGGP